MKVWLTGASGFVGSNVARVFGERHGAQVRGPSHAEVDVTDARAVRRAVEDFAPDAIVHCAILNDPAGLLHARRAAWEGYVGATRSVVDADELLWQLVERGLTGTFHCCGGEAVQRVELARRTVAAFGLDPGLLRTGAPDFTVLEGGAVPHDTSLDATATAAVLGVELPGVDAMLARLRRELDSGRLEAA
jgi:dTDP-4-dehydrorhamnose reductase